MSGTMPAGLRLLVAFGVIGTFAAACGGAAEAPLERVGTQVGASAAAAASAAPAPANGAGQQNDSSGSYSSNAGAPSGQSDILIIKTGTLQLRVKDLDAAINAASVAIGQVGGYVSASQRSGDGDSASASITYRIPAAKWDTALQALRGVGTKVLGEETQSQEVTGQVIDLGARITNLRSTEQALQAIMTKATKISDVLQVEQQLSDVRGQIEQLSTEKAHLEAQAAFSTLTVNFSLATVAVAEVQKKFDPASEVDRASASLVDGLQGLATAGIWFGIVWLPTLLGLGLLAAIGLFVARRLGLRRGLPPPPSVPPLATGTPEA